jgi:hypothetical protein
LSTVGGKLKEKAGSLGNVAGSFGAAASSFGNAFTKGTGTLLSKINTKWQDRSNATEKRDGN